VPGPGAVFDRYNSVIPDLVFVTNERWASIIAKDRFNAAPDLVIEIVSPGPTNRSRDFNLKRKVYGKFAVPEYWILDTWSRSVVIFRLAEDNILKEVMNLRGNEILESPLFPGLALNLSEIFLTGLQDSED
jgi:Uma2 family endonuclease